MEYVVVYISKGKIVYADHVHLEFFPTLDLANAYIFNEISSLLDRKLFTNPDCDQTSYQNILRTISTESPPGLVYNFDESSIKVRERRLFYRMDS